MPTSCDGWGLSSMLKACWTPPQSSSRHRSKKQLKITEETEGNDEKSYISSLPDELFEDCLARLPRSSLQASMSVSRGWYKALTSNEYYDLRRRKGRLENMLHVFWRARSGLKWAAYNKNSHVWTRGSLSPRTVTNVCDNEWLLDYFSDENPVLYAQPAVLNHKIFILGYHSHRTTSRSCTMIFDTWTNSFIRRAPMMNPRRNFACCVISGRIYVAGGSMKMTHASREAIVYIPESDLWKPIPKMPTKRSGCLGAAVNGIFYVIGGRKLAKKSSCFSSASEGSYLYMNSMDSYDPQTNTWRETKDSLPFVARVIACTVMGSHIYVLCSNPAPLSFFKYDTINDSWSRVNIPFIPTFNLNYSCVTMGACVYIVQVQGCIGDLLWRSGNTRLVLIYDTELQVWSRGPDLPLPGNVAICAAVEC